MDKWEKRLIYLVVVLVLFGLYRLETTPKANWDEVKYHQSNEYSCSEEELEQLLRRRLGNNDELVEKKLQLTPKELREYVYNLGKDAYPMESLGDEAAESTELKSMEKIGRLGLVILLFLAVLKILSWIGLVDISLGVQPPEKD